MARTNYVKKAQGRKDGRKRTCHTCHAEITVGSPYKWFASKRGRYSVRFDYHADCRIRPSDRTTSRMGQLYDAQEDFDVSECTTVDEITEAVESLANVARELAGEYQESLDAMPENLQYGPTGEQIGEYVESLESFADELEGWAPSENEPSLPDEPTREEYDPDEEGKEEFDDAHSEWKEQCEQATDEWLDTIRSEAEDAAQNFSA